MGGEHAGLGGLRRLAGPGEFPGGAVGVGAVGLPTLDAVEEAELVQVGAEGAGRERGGLLEGGGGGGVGRRLGAGQFLLRELTDLLRLQHLRAGDAVGLP